MTNRTNDKQSDLRGLTFNIQRFSIHDGPGIRTTVFMKGCPLRCKWCSNPESMNTFPEVMTFDVRCIACLRCQEACPQQAITSNENGREIDRARCNRCMACVSACPSKAIERVGTYMSVEEVVREVMRDQIAYRKSGGGMTISGGEALRQWRFVREVFKICRENGVHTALDTTGHARWSVMESVLEYVDLVLFDMKHMDSTWHKKGTGSGNELILKNAEKTASRVRTWLRLPFIPGYNDTEWNIGKLTEFAVRVGAEKISLLPYHAWGEAKYDKLGLTYGGDELSSPSDEWVQRIKEKMEASVLTVTIGR